jgi:DNA modification methylase
MSVDLRLGDCLEVMKALPDGCVDLTVTSPPYDNLRKYNGYTFDFEPTARELYRVTKPGGVVVWVAGDATINGSETGTSFRQALYFKEIGFNLHDTMIYQKIAPGSAGSLKCYLQTFEYMFVFSKGAAKTFNVIRDRKNVKAGQRSRSQARRDISGNRKPHRDVLIPEYGRRFNVWLIDSANGCRDGFAIEHPAVFPEALARDHILSWSNPGDTVMDCFMGSGTTGKMAVLLDRNFIGIEISPEYMEIAKRRIEQAQSQMVMAL